MFTPIPFHDYPSTDTPITAAALELIQTNNAGYTDAQFGLAEHVANKGQPNGYAAVDAGSRVVQSPKLHAADHEAGGADPLALNQLGPPTADVTFAGFKAILLGDPTAAQDGVNKRTLDTRVPVASSAGLSARSDGSGNVAWGPVPTFAVKDPKYGAVMDGVTDDGPALRAAWADAMAAAGEVFVGFGVLFVNSAGSTGSAIAHNPTTAGSVRGCGEFLTSIKLSSNCPRFHDFKKAVDAATVTGATTNGSNTVTGVTGSQAGFANGMAVTGTGIPLGTVIGSGAGTGTWTLVRAIGGAASNATADGTPTLTVDSYDTFNGIGMSDLTIDNDNVGGHHHVVTGCYRNGTQQARISVNQVRIRRLRTINVPGDPTTTKHRVNLWIVPRVDQTDKPCTLSDHIYEDLDFGGGNMGLVVGGSAAGGAGTPSNCPVSRIRVLGKYRHGTGLTPPYTLGMTAGIQLASGNLGSGIYRYVVTFVNGTTGSESLPSAEVLCTTDGTHQQVQLAGIPIGPATTTQRKVYRTQVGGAEHTERLLTTIADNTTTVFTDNVADATIAGAAAAVFGMSCSNLQIGSQAPVSDVYIERVYGEDSGDITVEVDNSVDCWIGVIHTENAANGSLLLNNFIADVGSALIPSQVTRVGSIYNRATATPGSSCVSTLTTHAYGKIIVGSMTLQSDTVTGRQPVLTASISAQHLEIGSAHFAITAANEPTLAQAIFAFGIKPAVNMRFKLKSYTENLSGTYSQGQLTQIQVVDPSSGSPTLDLEIESMQINTTLALLHHIAYVSLGGGAPITNATIKGHVRNLRVETSPTLFQAGIYSSVAAAANLPGPFVVENCDFTGAAGFPNAEVYGLVGGGVSKLGFLLRANRYKTTPAISTVTLGASPAVYQNNDGWAENVSIGNDNGPVTKLEKSVDQGATWVDTKQLIGDLYTGPGGSIRVTYSGTSPTVKKEPIP